MNGVQRGRAKLHQYINLSSYRFASQITKDCMAFTNNLPTMLQYWNTQHRRQEFKLKPHQDPYISHQRCDDRIEGQVQSMPKAPFGR